MTRLCRLLIVLTLVPHAAWSLEGDRDQPIEVIADRALRDDIRGYTVYNGDVRLTQGSLIIEADRVTIFHQTRSADRVVAEGQPARMQQIQNPGEAPMKAQALRIIYMVEAERVQLRSEARVEQDGAVVSGDTIDYLIPEQVVRADTEGDSGSRVQVVIPAERINRDDTETETETETESGTGAMTRIEDRKVREDASGNTESE
ncbi:lipopolysaccharide transport periplasmic protein LptA [Chromatocurvus halotolerans]|uniref:Lipopolysaccharide export system protein LptA n=1 Tax=Chromatocurvus halotolerans TaxID=1132028 RepID=A0A4R2KTW2_9GAMM|nr:lipopolysaccharide transport periplasmic protein LptA [Chromatocurvus halotolerans]TCO76227.1 lipopolysaccharide export system protein LptA [Chromatocurvus halotolerans]